MTAALLSDIAAGLKAGKVAPYLGPEVLNLDSPTALPSSSRELVERLNAKITVPGRIRGNLWSAAQWIESNKHRVTLVKVMQELFAEQPAPNRLHTWLAGLDLPLVVDEWYEGSMVEALGAAGKDFLQIQGVRRSGLSHEVPWVKRYDKTGAEVEEGAKAPTIFYKPHGGSKPAANFLVSDSDYVEVLTEIDIQTPIPSEVISLRSGLGFIFLGCRFYDQMQRVFARQIVKRSAGPLWAVLPGELTRNEEKFLEQENITRIDLPLADVVTALIKG